MRSRSFLHVSLGILALAAAYHLGARSATAQAGDPVVDLGDGVNNTPYYLSAVTADGDFYGSVNGTQWVFQGQVFSGGTQTNKVAALHGPINNTPYFASIVTENGDVYGSVSGAQWVPLGNVLSGPTPARQESFGAVKARYR
jgi:hypothetical protein